MLNQRYFPKYKAPHRISLKRATKPRKLSALLFTLAASSALTCFLLQENPVSVEFRSDMPTVVSRIDTEPVRRKLGCFPFVPIGNIGETNSVVSSTFHSDDYTYSGTHSFIDDGDGNFRIRFLTSGIFTPKKKIVVDIFVVGGGGGGNVLSGSYSRPGGGGGYTGTWTNITLDAGIGYPVAVGAGGAANVNGGTTSFNSTYSKNGGIAGYTENGGGIGGNGSSGGGTGTTSNLVAGGVGGSNGGNGGLATGGTSVGVGQGTTTREFGEAGATLYAGGGSGGAKGDTMTWNNDGGAGGGGKGGYGSTPATNGATNYGGGGGGAANSLDGSKPAGSGGSGIAIIRNHR